MSQINQIRFLIPLVVGATPVLCTIVIHALVLNVSISFVRRQRRLGLTGASFWIDVVIVSLTVLCAGAAHLIGISLWALLFLICGEFSSFGVAYYHSAVNYTTLGYGDLIMSPSWRLLGPLEAANGSLMFGLSTAMIFALIQRLITTRYVDLN